MTEAIHFGNDFNSSVASLRTLDAFLRNWWCLSIGITGGLRRNTQLTNDRSWAILESMQEWFKASLSKLSRKSDVTLAIHYALGRWPALLCYCGDGNLEIDNNAAERALRPVALRRKNYLFVGSNAGGERAAAMYSKNSMVSIQKRI